MPLRYESRWYTPELCRAEPAALFVFGDNFAQAGSGPRSGQAVIRHQPNAVGVPTKRAPRKDADAFLTDDDMPRFLAQAEPAFRRLAAHLRAGGTVVWPEDGIGTGRAQLAERAPRIWASLERARLRLEALARETAA